jgi:hypothetical protein
LIGIVSHSKEAAPGRKARAYTGCAVSPLLALPVWVVKAINAA